MTWNGLSKKYLEDNYVVDENWIEEYQEKAQQRAASSSEREKVL